MPVWDGSQAPYVRGLQGAVVGAREGRLRARGARLVAGSLCHVLCADAQFRVQCALAVPRPPAGVRCVRAQEQTIARGMRLGQRPPLSELRPAA